MAEHSDVIASYLARMAALGGFTARDRSRLLKLVDLCTGLPQASIAAVGQRHLRLAVRRKTFAYYLNDHHGDGITCVCCKSTLAQQRQLVARDPARYCVPAYLGPSGWVSLRLDTPKVDWDEVLERVVQAYRLQAPRRLAAEME